MVFVLFTKYLQNQSILTPCVILALLSNVFNIVCNYLMIYASGSTPSLTSAIESTLGRDIDASLHYCDSLSSSSTMK
jgi:hypothetical protein